MSDTGISLTVNRALMRVHALAKRSVSGVRMPSAKVIPYIIGGVSIVAGSVAILIAGTQLPKLRPEPLIITVPAPLPPPAPELFARTTKKLAAKPVEAAPVAPRDVAGGNTLLPAPQALPDLAQARQIVGFEQGAAGSAQPAPARVVDPSITLGPAARPAIAPLERVDPRPPLSGLYAEPEEKQETPEQVPAVTPGVAPEQWRLTRMFNPVASSAGRIEAKGHRLAIAGLEPLQVGEKCIWNGAEWPCGAVARTAFRSWLRARAVQCKVPPSPLPDEITAECSIGRDDVGEWLVSNGWARPEAVGPYAAMGDKAKARHAGIYGAPPKRISVVLAPQRQFGGAGAEVILDSDPPESTPDELNQDPEPGGLWPQINP